MALTADNSNVTLAEYRAYAADRGWAEASAVTWPDALLSPVCIEATTFLNSSFRFPGQIADLSQVGPFPRVNWKDSEGRVLTGTPAQIKAATIEAGHLAVVSGKPLMGGDVEAQLIRKKFGGSLGGIDKEWAETSETQLRTNRLALVSAILSTVGAVQTAGGGVTMTRAIRA